jgi:hypothetical protein
MYRLVGGGSTFTPILQISINDNSLNTMYYVVIPNDPPGAVSSRTNRTIGQHGATVHVLNKNNAINHIDTKGQAAYLFVSTLFRNVSNVRPTYSWHAPSFTIITPSISVIAGAGLVQTVNVSGSAAGTISINSWNPALPADITASVTSQTANSATITFTDSRTIGAPAVNYNGTVTLSRQNINAVPLSVNINLPATPRVWNASVSGSGTLMQTTGIAMPGSRVTLALNNTGYNLTAVSVSGTGINQSAVSFDLAAKTVTFVMPEGTENLNVTVTPTWRVIYGDITRDGTITILDLIALSRHIAEIDLLTGSALAAADVNGDGIINIADLTRLARWIAGHDRHIPLGQPLPLS